MTPPGSSHWTIVDGLKMHARRWGPAPADESASSTSSLRVARPPIVLVHGLGVSSRYMVPAGARLGERYATWAPDLPGFGESDRPDHAYSLNELVAALERWLAQMHVERPVLVGHSYGAQVVARLAAARPAAACGVVLAAPTVQAGRRAVAGELVRLVRDIPRERVALAPIVARDYLGAGLGRCYRTLRNAVDDRIEDRVAQIGVPTVLLRGARDPIVSLGWLEELARRMPRARVVTVAGAGHAVNFSAAGAFAAVVAELAAEVGAG